MILRSMVLRHGRIALSKPPSPLRPNQWRRFLASSTEAHGTTSQETSSYEVARLQNASAGQISSTQSAAGLDPIKADYEFKQHQRQLLGRVGADLGPHYKPRDLIANPPRPEDITLELLLASQTHLGHRTSLWHPANARYIFGTWGPANDTIHIIGLDTTAAYLRRACKVVSGVAARGGLILFVGTRSGHASPVIRAAKLARGCHLFDKWTPGTLTNAQQILGRCAKKVVNELDDTVPGFEGQLRLRSAIRPDLVVCLNPLENYTLLHECGLLNIPTVGIIDTDVNPTWVTYPIPANDDSIRSVSVIAGALGRAGQQGQQTRRERAKAGTIDFVPSAGLRMPTREEVQASTRGDARYALEDRDEDDEAMDFNLEDYGLSDAHAGSASQSVNETHSGDPALLSPQKLQQSDKELVSMTDLAEEQDGLSQLSAEDLDLLSQRSESAVLDEAVKEAELDDAGLSEKKD